MIKTIKYPERARWEELSQRPIINAEDLDNTVLNILSEVKAKGDAALRAFAEKFDKLKITDLAVSQEEIRDSKVDNSLSEAIKLASDTIEKFHRSQITSEEPVETMPGITCWRKSVPIQKVGLYIPGGSAPLFSTVLMLGIPAKIAGCSEIVLCTPPDKNGKVHPAILFAAQLVGIDKIHKVGGAQAIAAMAYGTESVPQVFKVFGPGNQYVTRAKELVQQQGVAIDMPAGPSEVLVIADETCNPAFVAADLLAQAEHGEDSQVVLTTTSEQVAEMVFQQITDQVVQLPRREIAQKALERSFTVIFDTLDDCMDFSNHYAPEHLIISTENTQVLTKKVLNAGSVFLGSYSCESVGDYASGTNHTLPTKGFAKSYSGVSAESYLKKITFQELTKEGLKNIGPAVEKMAEAESLVGHKNSVTLRLNEIEDV